MATGPVDRRHDAAETSYDDLARRVRDAERRVEELTAELAAARARIEELESGSAPLSLFDDGGAEEEPVPALTGDGSDPRILSLVLGATAVVAGMVALLALVNGNLFTPFGFVIVALTIGLAYAAHRARVPSADVSVVRGVVLVDKDGSTHRFDLKNENTKLDVQGRPGDAFWQVKLIRRGLEPFVVDASMVDPREFMAQLREYRPEL